MGVGKGGGIQNGLDHRDMAVGKGGGIQNASRAAGWEALALLEPGTPEVTGLGRNIIDKGEDPGDSRRTTH